MTKDYLIPTLLSCLAWERALPQVIRALRPPPWCWEKSCQISHGSGLGGHDIQLLSAGISPAISLSRKWGLSGRGWYALSTSERGWVTPSEQATPLFCRGSNLRSPTSARVQNCTISGTMMSMPDSNLRYRAVTLELREGQVSYVAQPQWSDFGSKGEENYFNIQNVSSGWQVYSFCHWTLMTTHFQQKQRLRLCGA
jgi:hypothetical protein